MNWYKYTITEQQNNIEKEAGFFSNISSQIALAISLLLGGASSAYAANEAKLPVVVVQNLDVQRLKQAKTPEERKAILRQIVEDASKNVQTVQQPKVKQPIKKNAPANVNLDQIISLMLSHENLIPKQTPFRITNKKMRTWDTIYGFPIDKSPNAPANRKNFIYLKNPGDVVPAVKKLMERYKTSPGRYSLPANPTLRQAIEKFDQSNARGKIEKMKASNPKINFDAPLSSFK